MTKFEAAPYCGLQVTAFVGVYWTYSRRLGLPRPVVVKDLKGYRIYYYRMEDIEALKIALANNPLSNRNKAGQESCRRLRQAIQHVTEEEEDVDPALRLRNQAVAANFVGIPLDEFLSLEKNNRPLPMEAFLRMLDLERHMLITKKCRREPEHFRKAHDYAGRAVHSEQADMGDN